MYSTITGQQLEQILNQTIDRLIVVAFSAEYSGQSRMLDAILIEIIGDYNEEVDFYKINTDVSVAYVARLGIYELPAIFVYDKRELVFTAYGLQSKSYLKHSLNGLIGR